MMYILNYVCLRLGTVTPVRNVGPTIGIAEPTVIKFATLGDALDAARAVRAAGAQTVFVSDTEDEERRYMIPRNPT